MRNNSTCIFAFLILASCTLFSCSKDDNQKDIDRSLIEDYLANKGLVAESTSSGLYYIIEEPGAMSTLTPPAPLILYTQVAS